MKLNIFLIILTLTNIACTSKNKESNMITEESISEEIQKGSQNEPVYVIEVTSSSPYEIYVNDIMVDQYYEKGAIDYSFEINQWLLSSGTIPIKAKIFPKVDSNRKIIEVAAINYFEIKLSVFEKKKEKINRNVLEVFKLSIPDTIPSTSYSDSWEYEFKLPYRLKGWDNSVVLENNKELLEEVIQSYRNIKNIINSGDFKEYLNIYRDANSEFYNSNYYTQTEIKVEEEAMKLIIKNAKGKTNFDTNCNLKIYGNKKLVTLELKDGLSPIYSDDEKDLEHFSLILHRPKEGEPLEVIR